MTFESFAECNVANLVCRVGARADAKKAHEAPKHTTFDLLHVHRCLGVFVTCRRKTQKKQIGSLTNGGKMRWVY